MLESTLTKESSLKEGDKLPVGRRTRIFKTKTFLICTAVISLIYLLIVGWCYTQEEEEEEGDIIVIASVCGVVAIVISAVICYFNGDVLLIDLDMMQYLCNTISEIKGNNIDIQVSSYKDISGVAKIDFNPKATAKIPGEEVEVDATKSDKRTIIEQLQEESKKILGFNFNFMALNLFITTSDFKHYVEVCKSFNELDKITQNKYVAQVDFNDWKKAFAQLKEACKSYVDRIIDRVCNLLVLQEGEDHTEFKERLKKSGDELCNNTISFFINNIYSIDRSIKDEYNLLSKEQKNKLMAINMMAIKRKLENKMESSIIESKEEEKIEIVEEKIKTEEEKIVEGKIAMAVETIKKITLHVENLVDTSDLTQPFESVQLKYELSVLSFEYIALNEQLRKVIEVDSLINICSNFDDCNRVKSTDKTQLHEHVQQALERLIVESDNWEKKHMHYLDQIISKPQDFKGFEVLKQTVKFFYKDIYICPIFKDKEISIYLSNAIKERVKNPTKNEVMNNVYGKMTKIVNIFNEHVLPRYIKEAIDIVEELKLLVPQDLWYVGLSKQQQEAVDFVDIIGESISGYWTNLYSILMSESTDNKEKSDGFQENIAIIEKWMKGNEDDKSLPQGLQNKYQELVKALKELKIIADRTINIAI